MKTFRAAVLCLCALLATSVASADEIRLQTLRAGARVDVGLVLVAVMQGRKVVLTARTDAYGFVKLDLPRGRYTLEFTKDNVRKSVDVTIEGRRVLRTVTVR